MIHIRNALQEEYSTIGQLMFAVYNNLEGFPDSNQQPRYFEKLLQVGSLTVHPEIEIWVAVEHSTIVGAVVYYRHLKHYGAGGIASHLTKSSGFRLLAVDENYQGKGIGKQLIETCIQQARKDENKNLVIHSTLAMKKAWRMYEKMGFNRNLELDFTQGALVKVFGFTLDLSSKL